MQMLIKNLLEFSRATDESENYEETNLNEIVASILTDLELNIEQKKAVISFNKLPTLKVVPDQFRQLFQNLITNSLKFCKPGIAPEITITSEKTKGMYIPLISYDQYEDSFYRIIFKDNGIGFEEKYADEIFMIFKRLHSFEQFEGTGIGLSICKKIVEKHHGFIHASGKPGEGATFTIILPAIHKDVVKPPEMTRIN
jgi:light-regulated signal transduction histidine kinase (bacteriophytochrome)